MDITGIGSVADFATNLLDRFFPKEMSAEDRAKIASSMAREIETRDKAKAEIMQSEMAQGDNFTKRARPTVVYAGLVMIAINYVVFPTISRFIALRSEIPIADLGPLFEPLALPAEFWWAWGGTVSIWILGRSAEKRGAQGNFGKIASLITGDKK